MQEGGSASSGADSVDLGTTWEMAATSAGHDRGNSNRLKAGNTKNIGNTVLGAVERDCFENGSDVGRWAEMDYSEGKDEENEGKLKGELSEKKDSQGKGNKRIN